MSQERITAILDFWFQGIDDTRTAYTRDEPFSNWFNTSDTFDEQLKQKFLADHSAASKKEYDHWRNTPKGTLALILILDQFSRNLFRGTPEMYAQDEYAQSIANQALDKGLDLDMLLFQRIFMYMPLMHSEHMENQERSVECFIRLWEDAQETSPRNVNYFKSQLTHARRFRNLIKEDGRFVKRDKILRR